MTARAFFRVCLVLIFLNTIVEKTTLNPEIAILYQQSGSEKKKLICALGLAYLAQRFNRPFDKNPRKHFFGRYFCTLKRTSLAEKMGLLGEGRGRFWLKCSPSSADWSQKVSSVSPHRKKFPHAETKALVGSSGHQFWRDDLFMIHNILSPNLEKN